MQAKRPLLHSGNGKRELKQSSTSRVAEGARASARKAVARTAKGTKLLPELRTLIAQARDSVAREVNSALVHLYWQIGLRIRNDILAQRRAEYGGQIVAALGRQLEAEFGRGFGEKNLHRMVQFAEAFPDKEIVAALRRQLGWTHFRALLPIQDATKRAFYAEMCRVESWSTSLTELPPKRILQQRLNTAIARARVSLKHQEGQAKDGQSK